MVEITNPFRQRGSLISIIIKDVYFPEALSRLSGYFLLVNNSPNTQIFIYFENFSTKMRAWYFDESCSNPREECVRLGSPEVTKENLEKLGLKILTFDADNFDNDKSYIEFKEENNYDYQGNQKR